ncbi:MAG: DNA primase [Syntrophaceae bacterium]|nr:DNA primase [Syntrophaceae bacterium]
MVSAFFLEEKVSEIRERANILDVVSDYVTLKKSGKNYRGLCPFHSEKSPSFTVNEEKQIFHCFGCGAGGDVFTFLMKAGQFSFPQAVEELAKRYGVKLPSRELSPAKKKDLAKRELLFQINQIASDYFHDLLLRRREGEEGRRYLSRRGIGEGIIKEHRLGYSLDHWDGLTQHLREKKVPLELAWELGLIFPKKREGWYDAFRGRVLFPIFDLHQRVVGFGGRLIRDGEPKYLNSPESTIYHKAELLYGLQVAKGYIPQMDCVIMVEGYFDLLTLHQYGLRYSVATLGTALTPQHVRFLKRYTKNFITVFDADEAGIRASLRALPLFLEEEVSGRMLLLPEGEDPDGFLRKGNLEEFQKRVREAVPLIDFFFERLTKTHDIGSIEGKVRVAEEGMALLAKIPNQIRRNFYTRALAERLDLPESLLTERTRSPKDQPATKGGLAKVGAERPFPKAEETVVRLMIHHPELIPVIREEGVLGEFESPVLQKMGQNLEGLHQRRGRLDLGEALDSLEEDLKRRLCEFAVQESDLETGDREKILRDCIQKIRRRRLKREEGEILGKIREAEKQTGEKGLEALLLRRQELTRRGRSL